MSLGSPVHKMIYKILNNLTVPVIFLFERSLISLKVLFSRRLLSLKLAY